MKSFLLQDWIQIGGGAGTSDVYQSESQWLDLSAYRDVVGWLDVKHATSSPSPSVIYETAPAKDALLFAAVASVTPSIGLNTSIILQDTASVPLARWFRWHINASSGTWGITFRIWIAANKPGRRSSK